MKFYIEHQTKFVSFVCIVMSWASIAGAEVRPLPGSVQAEVQVEAEDESVRSLTDKSEDRGLVQLLNFLPSNAPPIAVFLIGESITEPEWPNRLRPLVRGSLSPDSRPFEALKEGTYQVVVRKETTQNFASDDPEVRIPKFRSGEELAPVAEFEVEPGSIHQIIIWSNKSGPEISIQSTALDESKRSLQAWNLLEAPPIRLSAGNGEQMVRLADSLAFGPNLFPLPNVPVNIFNIEFAKKSGSIGIFPVEMEVAIDQNVLLVAFRDRYGRITLQGFPGSVISRKE
jgi:hypothetical protein